MGEPKPKYFNLESRMAKISSQRQENRTALNDFFRNDLVGILAVEHQITGVRLKNTTTNIQAYWQSADPSLTDNVIEEKYFVIEGLIGTAYPDTVFNAFERYLTLDISTGRRIKERKIPLPNRDGGFEFNRSTLLNQLGEWFPKQADEA